MLEWFKRHAWKACVLQKGTGGSNPFLSAKVNLEYCMSATYSIFFVYTAAELRQLGKKMLMSWV